MLISSGARILILIPVFVWSASVGVAELVFRQLGARTTNDLEGLYEPFGNLSYKHRASVRATADWASGRFSVTTDGLGFRCSQSETSLVPERIDVLLIGDSQGYGQGLAFGDSLAGRVAARGRESGARISNASVGGHYLENQFELVRWLDGKGLRPRTVVILLTPYLIASAGKYNQARVEPDGRLYEPRPPWYSSATRWLKTKTVVYSRVRNALGTILPANGPQPAIRFFTKNSEKPFRSKLIDSLSKFADWATERRISILLVYTPLAMELEFEPLVEAAQAKAIAVDADLPRRIAASASAELRIPLHDLRPVLAAEKQAGRRLTLVGDPHFNGVLSAACADNVWQALQTLGIVDDHPDDRAKEGAPWNRPK